jgi:hypothetical protein
MHLRWLLVLGAFVCCCGYAGAPEAPTLCDANEVVVFNCSTSRAATQTGDPHRTARKTISLCATPKVSASAGQIIYRFGANKQHVELLYPTDNRSPADAFSATINTWAKGTSSEISFRLGDFSYSVYNRVAVFEENSRSNGGGVRVSRHGKLVSDFWCDGRELTPAIQDRIWEIVRPLNPPGRKTDVP